MEEKKEVLAAAEERARALAGTDATALRRLLHPDFGWTSHTGERFGLESYVRANKGGGTAWHRQTLRDPVVVVVGRTAILTCIVVDEVDRGTFAMPMTQTWVRDGDRWLLLAGHAGPRLDRLDREDSMDVPKLLQTVLDGPDPRAMAEFWRQFLGYDYRPGDEPPPAGEPDQKGKDWLVLRTPDGTGRLAFQGVADLPRSTWPDQTVPQQLHLDLLVPDLETLDAQHERALALGATLLDDSRQRDPEEPLRVYADPAGHPFCVFVG